MSAVRSAKVRRPIVAVLVLAVVLVATVVAVRAAASGPRSLDKPPPPSPKAERDRALAGQAKSAPVADRCLDALYAVETSGHALPDDTEFRCPGSTGYTPESEQHWGATCWRTALCPGHSYVAINPSVIGPSDQLLRHVIAHEICHVITYARTGAPGSEPAADECAAAAGFPKG